MSKWSHASCLLGVPEKSLNRERETVNLNKEKLKPKGESEVQSFPKTCEKIHLRKLLSLC